MSAFATGLSIEREGWEQVKPHLLTMTKYMELTEHFENSTAQSRGYDYEMRIDFLDMVRRCEFKCERKWTGNLFIESYSNCAFGRTTLGWLPKASEKVDELHYYFLDAGIFYRIQDFRGFWNWMMIGDPDGTHEKQTPGRWRYQERRQGKYDQLNHTYGHCVPVNDIRRVVGVSEFRRQPDGSFVEVI